MFPVSLQIAQALAAAAGPFFPAVFLNPYFTIREKRPSK
jgi:hypothetical protein